MGLVDSYRKNWPRVGALLGMGIAGATALTSKKLTKSQTLAALNFAALTLHQYEEYEDPGYFPGQFNAGVLHSEEPDRYPLNPNTALIVNVPLAYTFYALPIALPKHRTLGLAPVLFGFLQAAGHGTIFPRLAGDRYRPGFLASLLLHVPIGVLYLRAVNDEEPLKRSDLAKAMALNFAFAATSIAGPNIALKDKNSPYRFTAKQMGRTCPMRWTPSRRLSSLLAMGLFRKYTENWPKVGAVAGMALGGATILAASRKKKPLDLRTLAIMNSITMAAHQVEEYVEPGYFPGQVNAGMFKSDQPLNYPFNAKSAALANMSFTALYAAPVIFPKRKWLGLAASFFGIGQVFAHWVGMPIYLRTKYAPGAWSALFLQGPIGTAYIRAAKADGPITRDEWIKAGIVGGVFIVAGVAAPNVLGADKNSTYPFTEKQMGPYT